MLPDPAPGPSPSDQELIKALGQAGEQAGHVLSAREDPTLTSAQRLFVSCALTLTADVFGFCKVCACVRVCVHPSVSPGYRVSHPPCALQEVDAKHRWALDGFSDLLGSMFKANMNLLKVCPCLTPHDMTCPATLTSPHPTSPSPPPQLLFSRLDKTPPSQPSKDRQGLWAWSRVGLWEQPLSVLCLCSG